jgi:3-methyladenine DNA glycosylase AlkD
MDTAKEITQFLQSHADEKYREFTRPLTNDDSVEYIGVRTPIMRGIVKEIAKGDWRKYIETYDRNIFECRILHGGLLSKIKIDYYDLMQMLNEFLPFVTSWALCDSSITKFKQIAGHENECLDIIRKYIKSEKQFTVRVGLALLFSNYINDKYIDETLLISQTVKNDGYYAKMMNAWLIAECCAKYPLKAEKLLAGRVLDKFTQNKAIQKARESYRVDPELKDKLTEYKIK